MKKSITLAFLTSLALFLVFNADAQTNFVTVTNVVTFTNFPTEVVTTNTTTTTNNAVLPPQLVNEIATSLGIPPLLVDFLPIKLIPYLFVLILLIPYIGRAWHSLSNNGGVKGVWGAVVTGTNVPVAMKVQATNQAVVPSSPPTPPVAAKP